MTLISRREAELDWERELKSRNWNRARIRLAMFDYDPSLHGPISYAPAPAWEAIARAGYAKREEYERIKRSLLVQGERFSKLGSASAGSAGLQVPSVIRQPIQLSREVVFDSVASVMKAVHPQIITQEQILRSAFIAHLPPEIARLIGSPSSTVHPERATPGLYQQTGTRLLRARFDLAFGDVKRDEEITGVIEIKAGNASFDNLKRKGEIITTETDEMEGHIRKRKEELSVDIDKMLDPGLPPDAFRLSWVVLGRHGLSTPVEIRGHAEIILRHCFSKRKLASPVTEIDNRYGWLRATDELSKAVLHLAWYRPAATDPHQFEPLWTGHP